MLCQNLNLFNLRTWDFIILISIHSYVHQQHPTITSIPLMNPSWRTQHRHQTQIILFCRELTKYTFAFHFDYFQPLFGNPRSNLWPTSRLKSIINIICALCLQSRENLDWYRIKLKNRKSFFMFSSSRFFIQCAMFIFFFILKICNNQKQR